ncbi:hypothetical protein YC2023_119460 [Brassica napus]
MESWGSLLERSRRFEELIFSTSERHLPANFIIFAGMFPAKLHGFTRPLSEHLVHDVYLPPVFTGEAQSFLKPPWPGDYNNASIFYLLSAKSVMVPTMRRQYGQEETMITVRNLSVLQLPSFTAYYPLEVWRWCITENDGFYSILVRCYLVLSGVVSAWFNIYPVWDDNNKAPSSKGGWNTQKTNRLTYQSQKESTIESILLSRTRIRTNWYRVDSSKHVPDTMGLLYDMEKEKNVNMAYLSYQSETNSREGK